MAVLTPYFQAVSVLFRVQRITVLELAYQDRTPREGWPIAPSFLQVSSGSVYGSLMTLSLQAAPELEWDKPWHAHSHVSPGLTRPLVHPLVPM
jgi:hypothetical protein